MDIYWIAATVFMYFIGAVINYGLLVGHYCATVVHSEASLNDFKCEAMIHSVGSWLCVAATYPAVEYGKFGLKFK